MNLLNAMAEGLMKLASLILGPAPAAPEPIQKELIREQAPVLIPVEPRSGSDLPFALPRRLVLVEIPGGVILMPEPRAQEEAGGRQLR